MSKQGKLLIHPLAYEENSARLFSCVAHEPWALFLDSGKPVGQYGRYDIIVARPVTTVTTSAGLTTICRVDQFVEESRSDPFETLKVLLGEYPVQSVDVPFCGGAIGYFAYDLGRYLETLPDISSDAEHIPDMCIGIYDWAVIVDHKSKTTQIVSMAYEDSTRRGWDAICRLFEMPPPRVENRSFLVTTPVVSNMSEIDYALRFERVKRYITEGDCYQVNLAQRFSVEAEGDAWLAYQYLRQISAAPFMAYMHFPRFQVLSASPERFLQVSGSHVETRPIKGTRPRANVTAEDKAHAEDLLSSLKDRAENLMIVDLLRNDIGKSCEIGSVRADRLFALESFANVHHLVSTVTGKLAKDKTAVDLLRGCFPGGSITGAPKLRAMEIIEELEPNRRGLYCGAIGYIGFDGNMDTNIAIRTAVYSGNELRFWAGGGIVADSEMQKEYRETWDKAASMLQLVQYFRGRITE